MVTFYRIQNTDRFFNMIDSCIGRVLFKSSDGQTADLRMNTLLRELITMSMSTQGIEKLVLTVENHQDMQQILRYLMDCNSKTSLKQIS